MLFKYLFKNIFAKPGRLIVIMICMIVACFAGFLALDLGSTLGEVFDNFGEKYVGGADYLIVYFGTEGITDALFDLQICLLITKDYLKENMRLS